MCMLGQRSTSASTTPLVRGLLRAPVPLAEPVPGAKPGTAPEPVPAPAPELALARTPEPAPEADAEAEADAESVCGDVFSIMSSLKSGCSVVLVRLKTHSEGRVSQSRDREGWLTGPSGW